MHDFASDTHVFSFVRPLELIFLKGFCIATPIVAGGKAAGGGLALAFSHFNFARVGSRAFLRECVRVCACACVGTHPDASASGCGAFALLGFGAPVASLLHLRWVLVLLRWLASEFDARWLCLWWLPLSTYLIFV